MIPVSDVLTMLIPTGGWVVVGNEWEGVQFIEATPITKSEFDKGVLAYDKWKAEQEAKVLSDKTNAQAKLTALGLTADDLKALGL